MVPDTIVDHCSTSESANWDLWELTNLTTDFRPKRRGEYWTKTAITVLFKYTLTTSPAIEKGLDICLRPLNSCKVETEFNYRSGRS